MKRIFFVLMAIAAIAMTGAFVGCEEKGEPNPDENGRERNVLLTDSNGANEPNCAPIRMPL